MSSLVNCSACSRAVRVKEVTCPFCGATNKDAERPKSGVPMGVSRAAIVALGLTGLANAACYGGPPLHQPQTPEKGANIAPTSSASAQPPPPPPTDK